MAYEALAQAAGCAVGTAKSRVFRVRRQLEAYLLGEDSPKKPVQQEARQGGVCELKVSAPIDAR